MGAIQLGLGALASFLVGIFVIDSVVPMVVIMCITTITAFVILNIGKRNIRKTIVNSSDEDVTMVH